MVGGKSTSLPLLFASLLPESLRSVAPRDTPISISELVVKATGSVSLAEAAGELRETGWFAHAQQRQPYWRVARRQGRW